MAARKSWYIKHRNVMEGGYYVAMGEMTVAEAKEWKYTSLNTMMKFGTKKAYEEQLAKLRAAGWYIGEHKND